MRAPAVCTAFDLSLLPILMRNGKHHASFWQIRLPIQRAAMLVVEEIVPALRAFDIGDNPGA